MNLDDALTVHGYRLKDPTAPCDACSIIGTVGRAIKCQDGVEIFHGRYCAACWVEESARLKARWKEEAEIASDERLRSREMLAPPPSITTAMGAATWHGIRDFIKHHILPSLKSEHPPSAEYLAEVARSYRSVTPEMVGQMPAIVEYFIETYALPDRPPPDNISQAT